MRRMAVMLPVTAFFFFAFSAAMAKNIDVKVKGEWEFSFGWVNGTSFSGAHGNSTIRRGGGYMIDRSFITPESLDGVLFFDLGEPEDRNADTADKSVPDPDKGFGNKAAPPGS